MRCCIDWHLQRRVDCLLATADPSQALVSDMGPEYLTRDSDGDAVVVGTLDLAAILPASSDIEAASSGALAAANAAEAADAGLMLWLIGFRVLGSRVSRRAADHAMPERSGSRAAVGCAGTISSAAYMANLCVHPAARRQSVAMQLVEYAQGVAALWGAAPNSPPPPRHA